MRPSTNDTFYFASKDAFSKKGSLITLTINVMSQRIKTDDRKYTSIYNSIVNDIPRNKTEEDKFNELFPHEVKLSLEYWNGGRMEFFKLSNKQK